MISEARHCIRARREISHECTVHSKTHRISRVTRALRVHKGAKKGGRERIRASRGGVRQTRPLGRRLNARNRFRKSCAKSFVISPSSQEGDSARFCMSLQVATTSSMDRWRIYREIKGGGDLSDGRNTLDRTIGKPTRI